MPPKSPQPPMVISYLRFSSAEQMKGDSTRRQLDLSERYAKERGWTINQSLSDKGVSAFRGSNATSGSLSQLLELVKAGRIPRGSVLLVESLDRLSRSQITEALELFLSLMRSGLRIVTLSGGGYEYRHESLDLPGLMHSLVDMSRAHEESAMKSRRIGESWKAKRARIENEPLTAMVPAWLEMIDGKIVIERQKARIVQRIFSMAIKGNGIGRIVKTLNAENKSSIGRGGGEWIRSYVNKILRNRAVIGEFQPHQITHKSGKRRREPVGEPIKGYFPAVVEDQVFYGAQAALANRRVHHSGPDSHFINVFKGLLFDAKDKCPIQIVTRDARAYVSSAALNGTSKRNTVAFPVAAFEAAFLSRISETASLDLQDSTISELAQTLRGVAGKLATTEKRIADINAALADVDNNGDPAALVPVLGKLNQDRQKIAAEHESLQQQIAATQLGSPKEAADRIAELAAESMTGQAKQSDRLDLRQSIAQLVDRIDCVTARDGACTKCDVKVTLKNRTTVEYTAVVKNRYPSEVMIDNGEDDQFYINVAIEGQDSAGISMSQEQEVRQMWQDSVRPAEIAKKCKVGITQVYRIAGHLKRLKKWTPSSRWSKN